MTAEWSNNAPISRSAGIPAPLIVVILLYTETPQKSTCYLSIRGGDSLPSFFVSSSDSHPRHRDSPHIPTRYPEVTTLGSNAHRASPHPIHSSSPTYHPPPNPLLHTQKQFTEEEDIENASRPGIPPTNLRGDLRSSGKLPRDRSKPILPPFHPHPPTNIHPLKNRRLGIPKRTAPRATCTLRTKSSAGQTSPPSNSNIPSCAADTPTSSTSGIYWSGNRRGSRSRRYRGRCLRIGSLMM